MPSWACWTMGVISAGVLLYACTLWKHGRDPCPRGCEAKNTSTFLGGVFWPASIQCRKCGYQGPWP